MRRRRPSRWLAVWIGSAVALRDHHAAKLAGCEFREDGLRRIWTLAVCAAWALLIAPLAAFAGAQVEEHLAPSVVAGLARSIADNPVPGDYYRALGRYNGSLGRAEYPNAVIGAATRYRIDPSAPAILQTGASP